MIAAVVAAAAVAGSEPVRPRLLVARSGTIQRVDVAEGGGRTLVTGTDAAWSPDGTQIVFVRSSDLWTANADGTGERRIVKTPNVEESEPAWSPDGRWVVYTATIDGARQIRIVAALGAGETRHIPTATGESWSPSFSRDATRVAFLARPTASGQLEVDVSGLDGSDRTGLLLSDERNGTPVADARDLDWSPDGTSFAYTAVYDTGTAVVVDHADGSATTFHSPSPSTDEHPIWSPDGTSLAYDALQPDGTHALRTLTLADSGIHLIGLGVPLDWRPVPLGRPLFPDLVQRPPSGLLVSGSPGHWLLGFTSLVDNRGPGVLWVRGVRPKGSNVMDATQLVRLAGGVVRRIQRAGQLHYTVAPPHYHWHWLGFDRYELRSTRDFKLLVRDHKSGFCIADHYGIAQGVPHGPPRFLGDCEQFHPQARSVEEGSSVGYTDRYPANFHGQNLNVSKIPAGTYWLVHRANSEFRLRERRYDNDSASLLVRISWPHGHGGPPVVTPLRRCLKERC